MKLHRFYVGSRSPKKMQRFGSERCWVQDEALMKQWLQVLRFRVGEELALFDDEIELLYKIAEIKPNEIGLEKMTELRHHKAHGNLLAWSLLKKDNNDLIVQKTTELGINRLVPLVTSHTEKQGFSLDRAEKIAIEAAEQCGRGDIPVLQEPIGLEEFINEFHNSYELYYTHIADEAREIVPSADRPLGVLIGPEGGWADEELQFMMAKELRPLSLGDFVLRAETAAIVAASKVCAVEKQSS